MTLHVQHHISDELLLDYATGNLAEGWSIAVATHLALCPSCRNRLSFMEHTGGQLLEATEVTAEETPASDSWSSMKAKLKSQGTCGSPRQSRLPLRPIFRFCLSRCAPILAATSRP